MDNKCPACGRAMMKNGHTPGGRQRWTCRTPEGKNCYSGSPGIGKRRQDGTVAEAVHDFPYRGPEKCQTFIVTYAQNATPVHAKFWASLQHACKHYDAQLIVQPGRYTNPNSQWTEAQESADWYDDKVVPFLCNERLSLNSNLEFMGDIPIVPTAEQPLTGLEGFGARSKIVGHPRLHLKTVATPSHKVAALLTTTGACTKRNYTRTRLGKKGEFHHTLGAVLVEIEGGLFWLSHITASDNGVFIDRGLRFTPTGLEKKHIRAAGAVLGDTHARVADPAVDVATFGPKGIVEMYRPRKIIWHDLDDAQSHNHHDSKDPFVSQALATEGKDDVEGEVKEAVAFVRHRTPPWAVSYVVASNHHDFLSRWIIEGDWKKLSPKNREFYLANALLMVRGAMLQDGMPSYPSPFPHHVNTAGGRFVKALKLGESLMIEGIQCGFHGHKGPNGARGSIKNMRRIGEKTIIGHSHSPGIDEGAMQVGHSAKPNQPYAAGSPSSWMHAHALIWPGGKRQLVFIVQGRHRR